MVKCSTERATLLNITNCDNNKNNPDQCCAFHWKVPALWFTLGIALGWTLKALYESKMSTKSLAKLGGWVYPLKTEHSGVDKVEMRSKDWCHVDHGLVALEYLLEIHGNRSSYSGRTGSWLSNPTISEQQWHLTFLSKLEANIRWIYCHQSGFIEERCFRKTVKLFALMKSRKQVLISAVQFGLQSSPLQWVIRNPCGKVLCSQLELLLWLKVIVNILIISLSAWTSLANVLVNILSIPLLASCLIWEPAVLTQKHQQQRKQICRKLRQISWPLYTKHKSFISHTSVQQWMGMFLCAKSRHCGSVSVVAVSTCMRKWRSQPEWLTPATC